jgi:hypothetical protein
MSKKIRVPLLGFGKPFAALCAVLVVLLSTFVVLLRPAQPATAATNSGVNFQARLMSNTGGIVPDGYYNVEFKLYDASTSGTLLFTDTYYDSNGATAGQDARIRVANGYLTVNLGTQSGNPFPSTIKWDQEIWLTMNIGGTTQTATPTWDGEMSPRLKLTAVPYAFRAGQLAATVGSGTGVLKFGTLNQDSTITLPDPGVSGAATVCYQGSTACGFVTGASTNFIQNGTSVQTGANFAIRSAAAGSVGAVIQGFNGQTADLLDLQTWNGTSATTVVSVSNTGLLTANAGVTATGSIQLNVTGGGATSIGSSSAGSFTVGAAAASSITVNGSTLALSGVNFSLNNSGVLSLAGGQTLDVTTPNAGTATSLTVQPGTSSGASSNGPTLNLNGGNGSGTTTVTGGAVNIQGGNATGASGTRTGGNVSIDAGTGSSFANNGTISIGTTNATTVTVGGASTSVKVGALGTATANSAAVCRDVSTNQLTSCDANTTGRAFVQGGNSFGATAVLGTNDANNLQIITGASGPNVRATFDQSNNLYLGNGITANTPNSFNVISTGSAIAGTNGASLKLQGGAGASATTGSAGGAVTIQGGNAAGSGNNAGGNIVLNPGTKTNTGAAGTVLIQPAAAGNDSTTLFNVKNAGAANVFTVDTVNARVGIGLGGSNVPSLTGQGLEIGDGSLRFSNNSGANKDFYVTPAGASVRSIINVVNFDPGSNSQIMAFGLPSTTVNSSTRALSVFDGRNSSHQPTISLFSVDENSVLGFSWDGSSSVARVKTDGVNASQPSIVVQPGASTGGTAGSGTIAGGDVSGAGVTGGAAFVLGGNATGSGTLTGGAVTIDGGTGSSANGIINLGVSNSNTINIGSVGSTAKATTVHIADTTSNTNTQAVTIGSTASNTNNLTIIQGGSNTTQAIQLLPNTAGGIMIGATAGTGTITLGQSTASNTINIGSANFTAANTQTINIANGSQTTAASTLSVNILSGAAGNSGTATLSLANNDRVTQVDIGNVVSDANRTINLFSGNTATGITDTINIGTGNTVGTGSKVIHIGDGTPAGTNTVTIGSIASTGNVTTIQGGNTATGNGAISIQAASSGIITVGTANNNQLTLGGSSSVVKLGNLGTSTSTAVAVCRDSSTTNLVACGSGGTGAAFIQGGNAFGATGVLGTTDANNLQIITGSAGPNVRATFDQSNNLYLGNGITAGTPNNFNVISTGSQTAGTNGASLKLQGGAGASATTGSAGGAVTIQGGNAGGSGNNAGGNIVLNPGTKTNTGAAGTVLVQPGAAGNDSASLFSVKNAAGTNTIFNVDSTNGYVGINTAAPTADLTFGQGADRTVNVQTRSTNAAGNSLTLKAGDAGTGAAAFNGGNLTLQAGNAAGTGASDGGSIYLKTGLKNGGGDGGQIVLQNTGGFPDFVSMQNASGEELFHLYDNTASGGHYNGALFLGGPCCNISTPYQVTLSATDVVENSLGIGIDTSAVGAGNGKDLQLAAGNTNDTNMNGGSVILTGGNKNGTGTVGGVIVRNNADGANAFRVQNNAGSTDYVSVNSSTGAITLGSASQTGTITVGQSSSANTINIGSANFTAANAQTINIANGSQTTAASTLAVNILSGSAGNSGTATLSLANNDRVTQVDIGNVVSDANRTVNLFSGNTATGITDTINIGTGNTVGTGAKVIHIGDGTPAGTNTVTIGSIAGTGNVTTIQGGNTATGNGAISIQAASSGVITIGTANNNSIKIGSLGTTTTNAIAVCRDSSTGALIGCGSGTANGTPFLQGGNSFNTTGVLGTSDNQQLQIKTNNTVRATFDNATNSLYLGLGVTNAAPTNFTLSATASGTTGVAGATLTVQGGNATVGNANGGNLNLNGGAPVGTGSTGLVVINTPTFQTASTQSCGSNCTITQANVDGNGAVVVNATAGSLTVTMNDPTITTAGRIVYVTAANGSNDFTLSVNGGGTGNQIAMRQNTTATMIWNGSDWTAAGASSSTTLQAAYDNTLTSAGGAELVLSNTANANGLTIRDSSSNPVNGTLLEVQNKTAATVFSVNSSVTDYANNGGAETAFGTEWASTGTSTVSRNTSTATYIDTGVASVSVNPTAANSGVKNVLTSTLTPNLRYNVSFAARLTSGSATFSDLAVVYSVDGSASSATCTNYSTTTVNTSVWTKVNCTFTAPSSGLTSSNAVFIRQTASATRTFYVDNFSVTVSGDLNYATDGGVDDNTNFGTNWTSVASATVTRSTSVGNDTSDSAQVVTTTSNQGVRNKLSINPFTNTLYRITAYAASTTSGFNTFTVRYSRDGGTNFVACADYNTQAVSSSTTSFTQITCYITTDGTSPTNPYVYFTQTDSTGRTWYVDTFSMALSNNTVPNVQVGGGVNGGPLTLFTLDRGASAPIAANNDALLGSMYYDTTLGKLQCYEVDGWGACGSSPDNIITLSPEYTNAVLHGTGVGTMTSDFCSDTLNINDGSSGQATICGTNETYNFYKWTSPQPTSQTYSVYVTYQLPLTFKTFSSGQTSIMGRTDNGPSGGSATVQYSVYRNDATGLTQCGSTVAVSTGTVSSWQTGIASGAADPSTCSFTGGNSLVFKIDVVASKDANAYVGNIGFTFTNK